LVATLGSCFVRHRIDVTEALKPGTNELRIRFSPAGAEAIARAKRQPFPIPWSVSNNRVPDLNMIRKPQSHGGWDWGLCLMVAGIYAEPILHLYDVARIEAVQIRQRHHADGSVTAIRRDRAAGAGRHHRSGDVRAGRKNSARRGKGLGRAWRQGDLVARYREAGAVVAGWPWCDQPLYEAVVTIPGDTARRKIGFRTLEVVTEKDEAGASMFFRVNGIDIFAKGANWIPADALPSAITTERIDALLTAAVEANMNMIRVWGGGFYEFDAFLRSCDRLGLLVWQDFMFSCNAISLDAGLSGRRLISSFDIRCKPPESSRPSIALWCGDNELIGSLNWFEISRNNRDRYLVNYDRLNRVIEQGDEEGDPDRRWWPSSPCNRATSTMAMPGMTTAPAICTSGQSGTRTRTSTTTTR
jgi:beta-mannosidase